MYCDTAWSRCLEILGRKGEVKLGICKNSKFWAKDVSESSSLDFWRLSSHRCCPLRVRIRDMCFLQRHDRWRSYLQICSRSWATTVPNEMCDFMDLFWYSCHKNWESYQSDQHWVNFVLSFCWTFKVGTIEPGCHRWMLWTVFWSPAAQSTWITIHRGKKRKIIDSKGPFPERAKRLVPRKGTSWTWNEIIDLPSLFHQDLDSLQWVQDKMGGAFYRQQWEVRKVKMTPFSCGPKKDVSLK